VSAEVCRDTFAVTKQNGASDWNNSSGSRRGFRRSIMFSQQSLDFVQMTWKLLGFFGVAVGELFGLFHSRIYADSHEKSG
jgi:hypothetical protein